ncbi:MAG TPA: FAD-dependent oxidoreductase [Solirubrobacteraceae bacterium]|nr:FAD-dependent oxidoreductase [Solirubrobacteraceae bacterium]
MSAPVVVVGAGPAGLAAAIELRRRDVAGVLVLDREREPGGIPRHAAHQGFGARDLRRALSGPEYARRYATLARAAGAEIRTEAMVTGWTADGALEVTSPSGRERIDPAAVILATGCRERPRAARLVPGSRPAGVMTTGTLQQHVRLRGERVGTSAVVVGAEHVSFSAVAMLAEGGARTVAMVTAAPRHESFPAFRAGAALRYRTPLHTRTAVTRIEGRERVAAVELTDLDSGATRRVACDTVVFTADWIPEHELAALAGIALDAGTRGPAVDAALRTDRPGVFAAGNLLHGAEAADVAALSGRHAGAAVAAYVAGRAPWPAARVPVRCAPPLRWIVPNAIAAGTHPAFPPPRGRFAVRAYAFLRAAQLTVRQDRRTLWAGRLPSLRPGRSAALPAGWTGAVDPAGGAVEIAVARARLAQPLV